MEKQKKTLQLLEKVTRVQVEREFNTKYPICRGFLHQPVRPKRIAKEVRK